MKFTLILCTYMRPKPLLNLLQSVKTQTLYPNEILIVDASVNQETKEMLEQHSFENLHYFLVAEQDRGLTRQRNYGIERVGKEMDIVCFLDDDVVLEYDYFEQILKTFRENEGIAGVGGVAINENRWMVKNPKSNYNKYRFYFFEEYVYPEGIRNVLRNYLGLQSNLGPGKMPEYSHGRTCGFPLNNKIYEVDLLIGMSFSFRRIVFENIKFSTYFEGYGLYEDADFSLRVAKTGKLYVNTAAKLSHYHNPSGRPNLYQYGNMVVRNGYYVWRVKNPNPTFQAKFKWHAITLLLMAIRFTNTFTTNKRKEAFTEALGRKMGWLSLFFNAPK
ncbi:MAG: glycosyl transferase family 2 [Flavobacteriaceae bacterium CG18_big_fil_WC_8_21_14_2_50_34_36]|nr:MAG: glycosyl transferase family 2 [Flavobacteriaceae bacterium CG18_big_fil_WC_8_21_14_2_50_34_36]PIV49000.1 MAG: glycosyl transferase family 2 [Flavobacteriaceae bacterium CG02_land_8_20_14_3_00_34_13]PIZ09138.1 MAG: glycosyl transferase family 2 [Flavobacteriaceae bacterium CG_4_10_14_0_8_um_filter_34_31]